RAYPCPYGRPTRPQPRRPNVPRLVPTAPGRANRRVVPRPLRRVPGPPGRPGPHARGRPQTIPRRGVGRFPPALGRHLPPRGPRRRPARPELGQLSGDAGPPAGPLPAGRSAPNACHPPPRRSPPPRPLVSKCPHSRGRLFASFAAGRGAVLETGPRPRRF